MQQLSSTYKKQINKQLSPLHLLQVYSHKLSASNYQSKHNPIKNIQIIAKGILTGTFFQSKFFEPISTVSFSGNFQGFFMNTNNKSILIGDELIFEGVIHNFKLISVNNHNQGEQYDRLRSLDSCQFIGYFKGIIQVQTQDQNLKPKPKYPCQTVRELMSQQVLEITCDKCLILPVFTGFLLKKINSICLDRSTAKVSGTLIILVQFEKRTYQLLKQRSNKNLKMAIVFQKQSSLQVPLRKGGAIGDPGQSDVKMILDNQNYTIKYTIRRQFTASIDNTYMNFFTPFNLAYLKIIISFNDLKISTSKSKQQQKYIHIKFMNYGLNDTINNNPFLSCKQLLDLSPNSDKSVNKNKNSYQLLKNRLVRVNMIGIADFGEYKISTSYLTMFSHFSSTFQNSNLKNSSWAWIFGKKSRIDQIKVPVVTSIEDQFTKRIKESKPNQKIIKLFKPYYWNCVHIQIPIFKQWYLHFIQIFIPLFILSALSLFIFAQQNGKKSDSTSTLNSRIVNVASIMIAFVALIPSIKQNAPRAVSFSFVYVVIVFSSIPNFLALASSVNDRDMVYSEWKKSYEIFQDYLFIISFTILVFSLLIVLVLTCIHIYRTKMEFVRKIPKQIIKQVNSKQFYNKKFQAKQPFYFTVYKQELQQLRNQQYIITQIDSKCNNDEAILIQNSSN